MQRIGWTFVTYKILVPHQTDTRSISIKRLVRTVPINRHRSDTPSRERVDENLMARPEVSPKLLSLVYLSTSIMVDLVQWMGPTCRSYKGLALNPKVLQTEQLSQPLTKGFCEHFNPVSHSPGIE